MILRSLAITLFLALPAFGEERTYTISLDGKPVGEASLKIDSSKDDAISLTSRMKSSDSTLSIDTHGTESWKDGRVVRLEYSGSENARKGSVSLVAGKDGYALKAGVKEVTVRGEVWPNAFWIRAEADKPMIVEAITGEVLRAKIEKIGPDRLTIAGKPIATTRYRVTAGGSSIELWYDAKNRLAKRSWTRDGHAIVLELTTIKGE